MNLNTSKTAAMVYRFLAFVRSQDNGRKLSFTDKNTFLGREESYKPEVAERARDKLKCEEWQEALIGSGEIIASCNKAMACADNLVNPYQRYRFSNRTNKNHKDYNPEAERALYEIYRGVDEGAAFDGAVKIFGRRYDLIAYLFFIKDSSRFLPISSRNLERSLKSIDIKYQLSDMCGWKNYIGFINIVRKIQSLMQDVIPDVYVKLIDAHSFLWVIHEQKFREWKPSEEVSCEIEASTEQYLADTTCKSYLGG